MNVPNESLDRWRAFCELVRGTTISARLCYTRGKAEQGWEQLQALHDAAIVTAQGMERAGAQRPGGLPSAPAVPLEKLSTPANRRYLDALHTAHAAALDVDEERGYGREGAGPASGMLEMLLADTQEEVSGPASPRE